MNIGRRVVPQGAQVDMLQHIQGLEQYGCLRPGGLTTDLIARKGSANGRFALRLIALQIHQSQQPANALGESGDAVRNLTLIKHAARCLQTGTA